MLPKLRNADSRPVKGSENLGREETVEGSIFAFTLGRFRHVFSLKRNGALLRLLRGLGEA